jgi:hypothetical protein
MFTLPAALIAFPAAIVAIPRAIVSRPRTLSANRRPFFGFSDCRRRLPLARASNRVVVEVTEFYSAIFLFACGLIYCGMGMTCRKQVKELMLLEQKLSTEPSP